MDTKVITPQAVATVIAVEGQAFARNPAGEMRPLQAGDVLLQGDTVVTMPGAEVQLAFADGHTLRVHCAKYTLEQILADPQAALLYYRGHLT